MIKLISLLGEHIVRPKISFKSKYQVGDNVITDTFGRRIATIVSISRGFPANFDARTHYADLNKRSYFPQDTIWYLLQMPSGIASRWEPEYDLKPVTVNEHTIKPKIIPKYKVGDRVVCHEKYYKIAEVILSKPSRDQFDDHDYTVEGTKGTWYSSAWSTDYRDSSTDNQPWYLLYTQKDLVVHQRLMWVSQKYLDPQQAMPDWEFNDIDEHVVRPRAQYKFNKGDAVFKYGHGPFKVIDITPSVPGSADMHARELTPGGRKYPIYRASYDNYAPSINNEPWYLVLELSFGTLSWVPEFLLRSDPTTM